MSELKLRPPKEKLGQTDLRRDSVCGAVKVIVGGVGDLGFRAAVRSVASRCRRQAALGVNALNRRDCRKDPIARMTGSGQ